MRRYPSKLLLFGEHVLLLGSSALAVPVPAFSGGWEFNVPVEKNLTDKLLQFADSQHLAAIEGINRSQFKNDLSRGLAFSSNIPVGYGLGSSGALCAAVYDRYCHEKSADARVLKSLFSQMESFFHGASSGIDPLTSYLQQPLMIKNITEATPARTTPWRRQPLVFLLDTTLPRQTGPLVQWFLEQSEKPAFRKMLDGEYLPAHEAMTSAWLAADPQRFWPALRKISTLQLEHFTPMIPETMREFWTQNIDNELFVLKICGAGGGGFLLGFGASPEAPEGLQKKYRLTFPFPDNHP